MDSAKLNDWLQVIGVFGVMASLVFVGLEVRQTTEMAQLERLDRLREGHREYVAMIVDNAEVWQRGCMGDELSPADQLRFAHLFSHYSQRQYISWWRLQVSNPFDADPVYLTDSVAAHLYRYPGVRAAFQASQEWDELGSRYTDPSLDEYGQAVGDRIAELRELEPEPLSDIRFCGS